MLSSGSIEGGASNLGSVTSRRRAKESGTSSGGGSEWPSGSNYEVASADDEGDVGRTRTGTGAGNAMMDRLTRRNDSSKHRGVGVGVGASGERAFGSHTSSKETQRVRGRHQSPREGAHTKQTEQSAFEAEEEGAKGRRRDRDRDGAKEEASEAAQRRLHKLMRRQVCELRHIRTLRRFEGAHADERCKTKAEASAKRRDRGRHEVYSRTPGGWGSVTGTTPETGSFAVGLGLDGAGGIFSLWRNDEGGGGGGGNLRDRREESKLLPSLPFVMASRSTMMFDGSDEDDNEVSVGVGAGDFGFGSATSGANILSFMWSGVGGAGGNGNMPATPVNGGDGVTATGAECMTNAAGGEGSHPIALQTRARRHRSEELPEVTPECIHFTDTDGAPDPSRLSSVSPRVRQGQGQGMMAGAGVGKGQTRRPSSRGRKKRAPNYLRSAPPSLKGRHAVAPAVSATGLAFPSPPARNAAEEEGDRVTPTRFLAPQGCFHFGQRDGRVSSPITSTTPVTLAAPAASTTPATPTTPIGCGSPKAGIKPTLQNSRSAGKSLIGVASACTLSADGARREAKDEIKQARRDKWHSSASKGGEGNTASHSSNKEGPSRGGAEARAPMSGGEQRVQSPSPSSSSSIVSNFFHFTLWIGSLGFLGREDFTPSPSPFPDDCSDVDSQTSIKNFHHSHGLSTSSRRKGRSGFGEAGTRASRAAGGCESPPSSDASTMVAADAGPKSVEYPVYDADAEIMKIHV